MQLTADLSKIQAAHELERRGRLAEAQALLDALPGSVKRHPLACLVSSAISRQKKQYDLALASLSKLDWQGTSTPQKRAVFFEKARNFDAMEDYVTAFKCVGAAREIDRADPKQSEYAVRSHRSDRQRQLLARNFNGIKDPTAEAVEYSDGEPNIVLLVGHPRSGTSLLSAVLNSHPQVQVFEHQKSLSVLAAKMLKIAGSHSSVGDINRVSSDALETFRRAYLSNMTGSVADGTQVVVENNPDMLSWLPIALRILPRARVLFLQRELRDLVVSCYMTELPLNQVTVNFVTPESTASRVNRVFQDWRLICHKLSREQLLTVNYEDLVSDAENTCKTMAEFLNLKYSESMISHHLTVSSENINEANYQAVSQPINSGAIARWKNYEPLMEGAFEILGNS